jgi:hypothetical protein
VRIIRVVDISPIILAKDMGCSCSKVVKDVVKGITVSIPKAVISGYATSDVIANRRSICETCEFNKGNFCVECSCFIPLKTTFQDSPCPKQKWE